MFKNASDQQENQPKRGKISKPDHNDSILMSKRLMQKRSSSKTRRHKRKPTSTYRIFPNAKPMPSLADLEKMFEDSDDDVEDHKSTDVKQQPAPKSSNAQTSSNITETLMIPKVMVTDVLLSPTKDNRIEEQAIEKLDKSFSSSHDDIEIISPSRKRMKSHEQSDESDDLPLVIISPKKEINTTNSATVESIMCQIKTKQSMIPIEPEGNTEKLIFDVGNDDSLNKLQSTSTLEAFSPIPSTSQSIEVLNRNENLLESVTENNHNLTKGQPLKQQIPKTHTATIVIEDEPMEHPPTDVKIEINYNFESIDSTNQITPTEAAETINRQNSCEDDDDCIIVETSINTTNNTTREPNIVDIEVINTESEHTSNSTEPAHDEIIDVEALIAQNRSIIDKYNATNPLNLLIDVDLLTVEENTNNPQIQSTTNNYQPQLNETPEQVTTSINTQGQPSKDHNLEHIRTNNTKNDSNVHSQPNTERHISEERYRMEKQRIYDTYLLSHSKSNSNFNEPLMAMTSNSLGRLQSLYRHQLPTSSSLDSTQYPTSSSSSDRTQYPTSSSSDITQYPTASSLRAQYDAVVAAIFKRRHEQKKRRSAHHTSVSRERPSKLIPSLGECPICMDNLSGKVIGSTICGHVFCMSCLQKAVRTSRRCPTCRKQLKYNGYHKLFL